MLQLPRWPVLRRQRAFLLQLLRWALPTAYWRDGLRELPSWDLRGHTCVDHIVVHRHLRRWQLRSCWLRLLYGMRRRPNIRNRSRFVRHMRCRHIRSCRCGLLHELHLRHIFKCNVGIMQQLRRWVLFCCRCWFMLCLPCWSVFEYVGRIV